MTTFLDDRQLGPAITKLLRDEDVRCAVAFWGIGAKAALFGDDVPASARVVCDISMGGSNPKELEALGAPNSRKLKHLQGLHAKVYLSGRGMIVASANASQNGIGFVDAAGLVEAGTFHPFDSEPYRKASAWFERIWKRASPLDGTALAEAAAAWRSNSQARRPQPKAEANPRSLLDTVAADPEAFRGVGFVFTSGNTTDEQRDEAVLGLLAKDNRLKTPVISRKDRQSLKAWKRGDLFSEWDPQDVDAWPKKFVCAHRGARGAFGYYFYERAHDVILDGDRGMVFAIRPRGLRREMGFEYGREELAATDEVRIGAIFEHVREDGHQLYENAEKLLAMLGEVEG